jgi:hypothetical protein
MKWSNKYPSAIHKPLKTTDLVDRALENSSSDAVGLTFF